MSRIPSNNFLFMNKPLLFAGRVTKIKPTDREFVNLDLKWLVLKISPSDRFFIWLLECSFKKGKC